MTALAEKTSVGVLAKSKTPVMIIPSMIRKGKGSPTPTTDYSTLAAPIKAEIDAARLAAQQGLEHARTAGQLLLKAKDALPHGEWRNFVEQHCGLGHRNAEVYCQLARNWKRINAAATRQGVNLAELTINKARALIAKPGKKGTGRPGKPVDRIVDFTKWVKTNLVKWQRHPEVVAALAELRKVLA